MDDRLRLFERLVERAREEAVPRIDTAEAVMHKTRELRRHRLLDRSFTLIAAGSFAMAAGVALFILPLIRCITDPLGGVFQISASLLR